MRPTPDPCTGPDGGTARREPVALVGIAALYPHARGADAYWRLLTAREQPDPDAVRGLADVAVDVARFGIPPAQARSLARMQLLMLEAARQCLDDAGHPRRALPTDRTDVIAGTCFGLDRQYANALRVEGSRYARDLRRVLSGQEFGGSGQDAADLAAEEFRTALSRRLGASPHDRVGEMAGTIPARVASAFKLRGRTLALESADVTSHLGLALAVDSLLGGSSDAVLVLAGQQWEGRFLSRALAAKGLHAPLARPLDPDGTGFVPGEGVGALLLKRLSSAFHDGDRVYATIRDCSLHHDARPGVFRYPTASRPRRAAAAAGHGRVGIPPVSVQYVECAGYGVGAETRAELDALAALFAEAAPGSVALGSARDRLGHTFANAGLASVTKVALALYHRTLPPLSPHAGPAGDRSARATADPAGPGALTAPFRVPRAAEPWPAPRDGGPRRAVVSAASLTGTLCHLILEEHVPDAAARDVRACGPAVSAEACAADPVVGAGGAAVPTGASAAEPEVTARPPAVALAARAAEPVPLAARAAEPVAVVGFAGRFAGARDADVFWQAMLSGRDRIGPLPEALLDRELYHAPGVLSLSHTYTDHGAPVRAPQEPPSGLRIPPRRYAALDAAQRLTLAVAGELFAGRGRPQATLTGTGLIAVGSNLGLSRERHVNARLRLDEYEAEVRGLGALGHLSADELRAVLKLVRECYGEVPDADSPAALDGCLAGGVAALLANEHGLAAVPVAVEAACASSLAALDVAVSRLRSGSADYAVAGGVELPCNARDLVLCSGLGLLSHERITPFDVRADGFTPGDGCALFLLRRYRDAVRDGDPVVAVLRAVGASNDAKSLIAPDVAGQVRAIERAFEQVDFGPADVDYLEAHGTGTRVGDRVEVTAAARVYGGRRRGRPLHIGSAKSFFGHTFAAAGGAGLLRVVQALRARTLPPNVNLRTLNPELVRELESIPARVATAPAPWEPVPGRPRRAAVSSFGTGGINYHLLIEEVTDGAR
ncbi:beta-ketoacyl [acyl carrier protein] synthase domain-containing protein [Streptomyces aurantiogriseus]|uniref:Polyketide synthase n=1 Tax=Streptomyces aurantiogriseus TaxID=66870 RepID=A0A918KXP8_9ACTN|nr:polyketide synthase [Streptomyces aurantiogriseus]GGR41869.1 polyketide synthase [Streptomyces aurantiogriseus]